MSCDVLVLRGARQLRAEAGVGKKVSVILNSLVMRLHDRGGIIQCVFLLKRVMSILNLNTTGLERRL